MPFLENFENSIFQEELPFAWPEQGCVPQLNPKIAETVKEIERYRERLTYMEEHGI
jgi:hypothetical protein